MVSNAEVRLDVNGGDSAQVRDQRFSRPRHLIASLTSAVMLLVVLACYEFQTRSPNVSVELLEGEAKI
eukprot:3445654-Rhodomonas_salina.1